MSTKVVVAAFCGAILGGTLVWLGQNASFQLTPVGMSYADLAATLLAAVGVVVAIFGGVLALAAIWGFTQLKRDAILAAENAGLGEIKQQISSGAIRDQIKAEIEQLADAEFESERMRQRIFRRVDEVAFGSPAADKLLEEGGEQ